jgi:hypothetical protein
MTFHQICYIEFEMNEEMKKMEARMDELRLKIEARRIEIQKHKEN